MWDQPSPKACFQRFPNQQFMLHKGCAELIGEKNITQGTGVIKLVWHPYPTITFDFFYPVEDGDHFPLSLDDDFQELKLTDLDGQQSLKIYTNSNRYAGNGKRKYSGYVIEPFINGRTDDLFCIVFHITNFYWFQVRNTWGFEEDEKGNEIEIEREGWSIVDGQLVFDYNNWHIVLGTTYQHDDLVEKLQEKGGYGLTHLCKIEKQDNTSFALDEGYEIMKAFAYYLSFARGLWVAPVFITGYDEQGNLVMEEWREPIIRADSWQEGASWSYNYMDNTELADTPTFSGYMEKWQDPIWNDVMQNCIQWFIEGLHHNRSENTSIILFQAALEKLAWTYLKANDCLTGDGFKRLKVADQIRLLINFLKVSIIHLEEYPELTKKAKQKNWKDSLEALGEVRNSIIHPQVKDNTETPSTELLRETASVARRYLMNSLLKICGYRYRLY